MSDDVSRLQKLLGKQPTEKAEKQVETPKKIEEKKEAPVTDVAESSIDKFQRLIELLPENGCTFDESDVYAVKFLKGKDKVNTLLRKFRNERIHLEHDSKVAFSTAFEKCTKGTVTEKKESAGMDKDYLKANVLFVETQNAIKYYKNLFDIFSDAHVYYKNLARDKT
jgi:hypothetical protein